LSVGVPIVSCVVTTSLSPKLTGVFRGSQARRAGLVTPAQLRGPAFRRLFQDVYVRADVPVTHELRCRGAALIVPEEAVLTGRSAATVKGVELAKPYDPVEFVVPEKHRFGPIMGIHVRRTEVMRRESRPWRGIRIAKPARIALDLVLRLSPRKRGWVRRLRTGVPDLDAFLRSGLVRKKVLIGMFHRHRNRGIRLARHALQLTDPRAESLPESELRVVGVLGGFNLSPQHTVRRNGKFVGRLDLALEEAQVAVEYDGRWHNTPDQVVRDIERRKRIAAEGWVFVIVDAERLANDYAGILAEIGEAQAAQLAR
jgi:very-short-patch-repair endonuclease